MINKDYANTDEGNIGRQTKPKQHHPLSFIEGRDHFDYPE